MERLHQWLISRLMPSVILLLLSGCAQPGAPADPPAPPNPEPAPPPILTQRPVRELPRDQIREGLLSMLNGEGREPEEVLQRLVGDRKGEGTIPYAHADLNGDGALEWVTALPVKDHPDRPFSGGALFVIYREGERWAVDRSEPMSPAAEIRLMDPRLKAVADLTGDGRPEIVWYRAEAIATGPQPFAVFATNWEPGRFTHLPGAMAISYMKLEVDGQELLLTGVSRTNWYVRYDTSRTDRYRFVDGAFRLVDRRFVKPGQNGYDRFWDGLVAESVGRTADAEQDYKAAVDPALPAHAGSYPKYNAPPAELNREQLERFAPALHALARFRLGGLLLAAGRAEEARAALQPGDSPYDGLLAAMREAANRAEGCQAAAGWAQANPGFLEALNTGVGHQRWTPELLCTHPPLEEEFFEP